MISHRWGRFSSTLTSVSSNSETSVPTGTMIDNGGIDGNLGTEAIPVRNAINVKWLDEHPLTKASTAAAMVNTPYG